MPCNVYNIAPKKIPRSKKMNEENPNLRGTDILESLDFLKDALDVHFANVRAVDSCFGRDHADALKRHIEKLVEGDESLRVRVHSPDFVEDHATQLPVAIARFAPRATFDPPRHLGLLGTLPGEIRKMIYHYALSPDYDDLEHCSCVHRSLCRIGGLALLRTSGFIYNEAIPILYAPETFGIQVGYAETDFETGTSTWFQPRIYRHTAFDVQNIQCLPHNALHLMQNLEVDFINTLMIITDERDRPFIPCMDRFELAIHQVCNLLKDSIQLNCLDITICFGCKFADIDYMTCLIEPMKMLREVKNPTLNIHCFQQTVGFPTPDEPRWHLHHDFEEYFYDILRSPHGTPAPPGDGLKVFHDSFDKQDEDLPQGSVSQDDKDDEAVEEEYSDEALRAYLRDTYGTEDLEALHGGLPARWQNFLNSEHPENCDWMDSIDPGHGDLGDLENDSDEQSDVLLG